jgi:hypothetical protein
LRTGCCGEYLDTWTEEVIGEWDGWCMGKIEHKYRECKAVDWVHVAQDKSLVRL